MNRITQDGSASAVHTYRQEQDVARPVLSQNRDQPFWLRRKPILLRNVLRLEMIEGERLDINSGGFTVFPFSPDGKRLAAGSTDMKVHVWQVSGGKEVCTCEGHIAAVNCLAFTPDGETLFSGSADKSIRAWDISGKRGKEKGIFEGHKAGIRCLACAPNGQNLYSCSIGAKNAEQKLEDQFIRVWDVNDGKEIKSFGIETALIGSLLMASDGQIVTWSDDNIVRWWDPESGKETHKIGMDARSIALSPDNQLL